MVVVKPEHSAGLGNGTGGYLLSIGGYPAPSGGFWSAYDTQAGTWSNLTTPAPYPGLEGHTAVSDPQTGLVYVIGGYYINNITPSSQVANDLTVFDPNTGKVVQQTVASQHFNTTGSSAVWSTRRKSVLLFHGWSIATSIDEIYGIVQTGVKELNVTSRTWSNMPEARCGPRKINDFAYVHVSRPR
ncbi:hypothetical protein BGZ95_007088 [Linnemannia exigua]|uniref:Kelch repeat protein n=1 Tax=Linnemannia exigua TaxID=604196 RepID=A0AAD4DL55_9FUNG|nr:hypothetical protein BGZ95_007088 [Linnemannia exigua]